MRFRRNARLDTGQVTDVRGRRMGGGLALGGGGVGVGVLVVYLLITLLSSSNGGLGQLAPLDDRSVGRGDTPSEVSRECQTGQDANERQDCRIVGVVNSVQSFWDGVFQRSGKQYPYVDTVFFTDQLQTGCGFASSEVGPFYCPEDQRVYIDLGFFDELQSRFGASGGPFAQAYVIAHEYGHHVQNQLGVLESIRGDRQGPQSKAVRSELQADCYAGVWAANALSAGVIEELTQADINEGLDAASAVGDDRIQERTQGRVNPESWTHGSSEQRRRWFSRGYENGKPGACDTFSGSI
jgi:predicted metalloprotease